jgi:hypothetical protein
LAVYEAGCFVDQHRDVPEEGPLPGLDELPSVVVNAPSGAGVGDLYDGWLPTLGSPPHQIGRGKIRRSLGCQSPTGSRFGHDLRMPQACTSPRRFDDRVHDRAGWLSCREKECALIAVASLALAGCTGAGQAATRRRPVLNRESSDTLVFDTVRPA